jgi:hypothetical protein
VGLWGVQYSCIPNYLVLHTEAAHPLGAEDLTLASRVVCYGPGRSLVCIPNHLVLHTEAANRRNLTLASRVVCCGPSWACWAFCSCIIFRTSLDLSAPQYTWNSGSSDWSLIECAEACLARFWEAAFGNCLVVRELLDGVVYRLLLEAWLDLEG